MHIFLYTTNFMIMIIVPIVLGWMINRNRSVGWRLFAIGCATLIISQIGHVPFNYIALPILRDQIEPLSAITQLVLIAVFLGLSAALFEEGARFIGYRFWAKDARTWGKGMMLGAGHGGAEAIILGVLVAINTVFLVAWRYDRLTTLIPAEQEPLIAASLDNFFSAPWYATILGAIERIFAIILHLSFSLAVMMAFVKRQPLWFAAAIVWHALADALAVFSVAMWGAYAAEALIAAMALVSLTFILRLRQPEPEIIDPDPLIPPESKPILQMELSADKLDDSKYLS
ncbi:MAG TPA: YhfC family glutamic-type intramembrane protease [candidate division Zixibacteria bacterium]|nr:YhfC family glutamic-type intramembrane protease [candidate division Zixibacteria bacterium]